MAEPGCRPAGGGSVEGPLLLQPERLAARLRELPAEPGCYLMRDAGDRILYIGKSKSLRARVRSYFRDAHDLSPRIALMVRQVCEIEFIVTDSEAEALALESNLIKNHQPHFNVLLKDDKKYPYLCITWSEAYPRIFITRRRRLRSPLDRFYGPYVDVGLLRRTLALVKRVFPLRQRPQPLYRDRTCLNYDIGRCPGVCQQKIASDEYHRILRKVAMVFQGRNDELLAPAAGADGALRGAPRFRGGRPGARPAAGPRPAHRRPEDEPGGQLGEPGCDRPGGGRAGGGGADLPDARRQAGGPSGLHRRCRDRRSAPGAATGDRGALQPGGAGGDPAGTAAAAPPARPRT